MSHAATLVDDRPPSPGSASILASALLVVWFGLILWFGATEAFVAAPGVPPVRLLVAVLGPVLAFLIAYRVSPAVRAFVFMADLRFITATQAWRFAGFGFLALYTYRVLPAYFAWPAGLGDMAIAFTAPWMLSGLARDPRFAASRRFVVWNALGMLDLVVAVSIGALVPLLLPLVGATSTGALARLPLVLIPGFFVPGYLILHVIALVHARRTALESRAR
jgi:hypothetical protein